MVFCGNGWQQFQGFVVTMQSTTKIPYRKICLNFFFCLLLSVCKRPVCATTKKTKLQYHNTFVQISEQYIFYHTYQLFIFTVFKDILTN